MSGPETDSATCFDCHWNASGPRSEEAAEWHTEDTGHRTSLHRWPTSGDMPLALTNKATRDIWHPRETKD